MQTGSSILLKNSNSFSCFKVYGLYYTGCPYTWLGALGLPLKQIEDIRDVWIFDI